LKEGVREVMSTGISILNLGLADGTRTVSSWQSPANDNAFSGRVKSVQNRSLSGNRFGTLICALVTVDISDTAPFLASFLGEFFCHPNFGYPAGNGEEDSIGGTC
jgi:hypothetical protein